MGLELILSGHVGTDPLCNQKKIKIKSHRRNREKQERKMIADDQRFPRIS